MHNLYNLWAEYAESQYECETVQLLSLSPTNNHQISIAVNLLKIITLSTSQARF